MFKKSVAETTDIFIGIDSSIKGDLKSEKSIRVDGKVVGNIYSERDVLIGPGAKVEGSIFAKNVEVSGECLGNIAANGHLKIFATGSLKGDLEVVSFVIEEGGIFDGSCTINNKTNEEIA